MKRTVDVNIPLGPIHPCFKEPARLKCEAKGERIVGAEVELGYMKKGIERIMKGRPWQEVMFLAERVCGICSVIHNMVFIEAMEQISGISVPPRAAYLRVIANELDRMQSHLLANFSYCYTIEHETLGMYLLDLREQVMDQLERLTGARVTCAYIIPGGVRCDIPRQDKELLKTSLDRIERATAFGEKRSRALYDNGDEGKGWFEIGKDGSCLHVSNSWCKLHHFQRDEALGQGWLNAVSERSRTLYVDAIQHAITDKRSYETEYVTALDVRVKLHADIVLSPTGELLGFVGFVTLKAVEA